MKELELAMARSVVKCQSAAAFRTIIGLPSIAAMTGIIGRERKGHMYSNLP